jgi:hypothetical protein
MRLHLRALVVSALTALAALGAACSDTAGTPTIANDASRATFADPTSCVPGSDAGPALGPATFAALYADIFRHEGVAKCQTVGPCHGGTMTPMGFPMGSTSHDLYCALTNHKLGGTLSLVVKGSTKRSDSALVSVLSPPSAVDEAFMPDTTHCDLHNRKLLPEELARIGGWLDQGASEGVADTACDAIFLPPAPDAGGD